MLAGHTKFSPDGNFGTAKNLKKELDCLVFEDIFNIYGKIKNSKVITFS
jgi:hypothetical protein